MKPRFKKFLMPVAALLLSTFVFAACGNNDDDNVEAEGGDNDVAVTTPAGDQNLPVTGMLFGHDTYGVVSPNFDRDELLAHLATLPAPTGTVTFGDNTHPDANIGLWGWSNPTPNNNARNLMHGIGTLMIDFNGVMRMNPMIVSDYGSTLNADGSLDIFIEIYTDLVFSDGAPITARDFVFEYMFLASNEMLELGTSNTHGLRVVGWEEYRQGYTPYFAGLRLYSDSRFGATIDASHLPFFFEALFFNFIAYPMHVLAPGVEIITTENGSRFSDEWGFDLISETVNNPVTGFRYAPSVVSGPYMFESFDELNGVLILVANPLFKGTVDGFRPQIERIIIRQVDSAVTIDALRAGEVDLIVGRGGADTINPGLALAEEGLVTYVSYPRDGYGLIRFHGDARYNNPLQFAHVRQAVTLLTDRVDLATQFTGGHATFIHGPYALSQWMYLEMRDQLYADPRFDHWDFNPARAEQLLIDNGWVLNAAGEAVYTTPGSAAGSIRHKDTEEFGLMPLTIMWLASTGNPVSDLIATLVPPHATAAGMNIVETRVGSVLPAASRSGEHADNPEFFMFNMGLGFGVPSLPWLSVSTDPSLFGTWNANFFGDEEMYEIANRMRTTTPGDNATYAEHWLEYIIRWNYLLPDMPLYADIFFDFLNPNIGGWQASPTWAWSASIVRAHLVD